MTCLTKMAMIISMQKIDKFNAA